MAKKALDAYYWAVASTLLCIPFYTFGTYCRDFKLESPDRITAFPVSMALVAIVGMVALYYSSEFNQAPFLYKLSYGNNILLMLINASVGILLLRIIANQLERIPKWGGAILSSINAGMIVILGFQRWFILIMTYLVKPRVVSHIAYDILSFIASIAILLAFVPIVRFFGKHLPAFVGFRKL